MNYFYNILKVFFANGVNILSGFGVTILLSDSLSVTQFGDYSILLSVLAFLLILPNSLNAGSLLFLTNAGSEGNSYIKTLFLFRTLLSVLLLIIVTTLSVPLSSYLHEGRVPFYLYIFLGIQALFSSCEKQILQLFQVQERFSEFSRLTLMARLLKIIGTFIIWYSGLLSLTSAIIILILTQVLAILPSLTIFKATNLWEAGINNDLVKNLVNYSGWILLSQLLVYIGTRANIIMISRYLTTIETGYFGFAITLLQGLFLLSQSVVSVITPKLLQQHQKLDKKKIAYLFSGLSVAYLLVVIIAPQLASFLVTEFMDGKYLQSTELLSTLAPAAWLFMVSTGPMILFHRWKQTSSIATIECCGAISLIVFNLILLPSRGIDGAVQSIILSRLVTVIIMSIAIFHHSIQCSKYEHHWYSSFVH